jgi:hypothetical protein
MEIGHSAIWGVILDFSSIGHHSKKKYLHHRRYLWLLNAPHIISVPFEIIDE